MLCYWLDNVADSELPYCLEAITNLAKSGGLPSRSLVLAERLIKHVLELDAPPENDAVALWEPSEHAVWTDDVPTRRHGYSSFFVGGWQTPVLIQLAAETPRDLLTFLPTPSAEMDEEFIDLVSDDEPARVQKKQRVHQ